MTIQAHQLRENYLTLDYNASSQNLKISLEVETRVLEHKDENLLDDNKNGIISYKELKNHQDLLTNYTFKHFKLFNDKKLLSLKNAKVVFHRYQDQTYMQLTKSFTNIDLNKLHLNYDMFFEIENNHKLIIHLDENRADYVLSNKERVYNFSNYKMTEFQRLSIFTRTGIHHILDGSDHLLFILMILLPAVFKGIKISLWDIFTIVTTFSIAHSLTLMISGLGIFHPNVTFIESSIALSIFVVAFMNLLGEYNHVNKKIVFAFGLIHGFGFANVLEIANVDNTLSFIVALFGFNFGVELGQIFVILLLLPFLYFVSLTKYKLHFIKLLALITLFISGFWFLQRVGLV
jgi:hypothetical protein